MQPARSEDINAEAMPDVKAIPPLQTLPKIVCGRCGGKALQTHAWQSWRYYRCKGAPQCVDPETGKPWVTKVLAV